MVDQNLADKCKRWVEEYSGVNSPRKTTEREYPPQGTPRGVSNRAERHYYRPTCWLERPSWMDSIYRLINAENIESRVDAKSALGKFDYDSLDRIFGQFGEKKIRCAYLFLPRLFCLITGKEPTYYFDENAEIHLENLLSRLEENTIRKAESIGAELVIMERHRINLREDVSPRFIHIAAIKLGIEYLFHYYANARAEFYRRNT